MQQDPNTQKVQKNAVYQDNIQHATRSKHTKGSKERCLLGQHTTCNKIQTHKRLKKKTLFIRTTYNMQQDPNTQKVPKKKTLFIRTTYNMQQDPNTQKVQKNAVYQDNIQHATRSKHTKGSKERCLLGQHTTCNKIQTHKRFKRTLFIRTTYNMQQDPNTQKVQKNAVYQDNIQHATRSKHTKGSKERCLLGQHTTCNKIQTHKRFKRTLFIRTTYNMQQDPNTQKVQKNAVYQDNIQHATRSKHTKGSNETLFIRTTYNMQQDPNTQKVQKNAVYQDNIQHATRSKHTKGSKERCLLGQHTTCNKIQTHKRFKRTLFIRTTYNMQQDPNTQKVQKNAVYQDNIQHATRSKHTKGSKERCLLGQHTTCNKIQTHKRFKRTLFIRTTYNVQQDPNTQKVQKNAVYQDNIQRATRSKHTKGSKECCLLGQHTTCNKIQTHKRFKRTLFIRTTHNMQQDPNTQKVQKNAVYQDNTQHATRSKHTKGSKERCLLGQHTTCNKIQTHKRFKRTLFIRTTYNMQQDPNTQKVQKNAVYQDNIQHATRSKHIKGSKERCLLGQHTTCNKIQTHKRFKRTLFIRTTYNMQQDPNTQKVQKNAVYQDNIQHATRSKHIKGSKERCLLGQHTTCNKIQTHKRFKRTLFIRTTYNMQQDPNTQKVQKNAVYQDNIQHATRSKHTKGSKECCLLGQHTTCNKIQTHKRFKRTLFIRTTYNMQQDPNTQKVQKNAVYQDNIQHATRSKHTKGSKERCLLGQHTTCNKIQTHKRFKRTLFIRTTYNMQQDPNTQKVQKNAVYQDNIQHATRSKHTKGSKERCLLGQHTTCNKIQTHKRFKRTLFIRTTYNMQQDPNTQKVQKNAVYQDNIQHANLRGDPLYQATKRHFNNS